MKVKLLKHQLKFMNAYSPDGLTEVALVGGMGSGKTQGFLWKTLWCMCNLKGEGGKSLTIVVYPDYKMGKRVFYYPFMELLFSLGIRYTKNLSELTITTRFGTVILLSAESCEKIRAYNATAIGMDEFDAIPSTATQELVYNLAIARLRGCANPVFYITTTPEGYKYTYRLYQKDNPDKRRILIRAKTSDNHHLPKDFVDILRRQYDPKLFNQYANGIFCNVQSGRVYYNFDRDTHVVDTPLSPQPGLRIGMDFNVNPMTAEVAYLDSTRTLHVFDEIILPFTEGTGVPTDRMAKEIKSRYGDCKDATIYPDPTGDSKKTSASETDIAILRRHGFNVFIPKTRYLVVDSVNTVNRIFLDGFGKKSIDISERCVELIADCEQLCLIEGTRNIDKSNPDRSHASDAFRYMVVGVFGIHEHTEVRSYNTSAPKREVVQKIATPTRSMVSRSTRRLNTKGY